MENPVGATDASVAVLVDCDNVPLEIVEHALLMGAQFGRVVLRRGYGNSGTLARRPRPHFLLEDQWRDTPPGHLLVCVLLGESGT